MGRQKRSVNGVGHGGLAYKQPSLPMPKDLNGLTVGLTPPGEGQIVIPGAGLHPLQVGLFLDLTRTQKVVGAYLLWSIVQ